MIVKEWRVTKMVEDVKPWNINENKKTLELAQKVGEYLVGYERLAIIPIVNSCTVRLDLPLDVSTNSNLLCFPKGTGKETFLNKIIAASNPNVIITMSDKQFESKLIRLPDDIFKNKVWTVEDLIVTLTGLSQKQRMQLLGFYTAMLANKRYERSDATFSRKIEDVNISCIFGIASDMMSKYKGEFFTSTFLERVIPIYGHFSEEEVNKIAEETTKRNATSSSESTLPKIELPLNGEKVKIDIPPEIEAEIINLAKRLHTFTNLSIARAVNYVSNFVKANALINNRETCQADIELYKYVEDLHFPMQEGTPNSRVYWHIANSQEPQSIIDIHNATGLREKVVRRLLHELTEEEAVKYDTGERGRKIFWV